MKRCTYEHFTLSTSGLNHGTQTLSEECDVVRRAWLIAMRDAGLHVRMGGKRQQVGNQGRIVLAWFQGRDDLIRYVMYDVANKRVTHETAEREKK